MQNTVRRHDSREIVHIDRKIPLWGVLGGLAVVTVQALAMYITQREQGTLLQQTVKQSSELGVQIEELRKELGQRNLKDVERDIRLNDQERRIRVLEDRPTGAAAAAARR